MPECQCAQISQFKCEAKSIKVVYNYPSPTSSSQTSSISITIPEVTSAAFWKLKVTITFGDLDKKFFNTDTWNLDKKGDIFDIVEFNFWQILISLTSRISDFEFKLR